MSIKRIITSDLNSMNTEKKGGNVGNQGQSKYLNKR